jgi:hypothetical protein
MGKKHPPDFRRGKWHLPGSATSLAVSNGIAGDDPAGSWSFTATSSAGISRRMTELELVGMYYLFAPITKPWLLRAKYMNQL